MVACKGSNPARPIAEWFEGVTPKLFVALMFTPL
jgi:hypothetical protein